MIEAVDMVAAYRMAAVAEFDILGLPEKECDCGLLGFLREQKKPRRKERMEQQEQCY